MVGGLGRRASLFSKEENASFGGSADKGVTEDSVSIPALTGADDGLEQMATGDEVLRCLGKSSEDRTDEDLRVIQKATSDVKFFEQLSKEEHYELCRVMTHRERSCSKPCLSHAELTCCPRLLAVFLPKDTLVFAQGDEGVSFYIIYMGATKVHVQYAPPSQAASFGMATKLSSAKLGAQQADGYEEGRDDDDGLSKLGTCVCVLEDGDSFGELALMGNGIRQASVVTAMETHFLKIEKKAYELSLQKLHEEELSQRTQFVQGVFIFSDWTDEDLRRVAYVMTSRRYEKNTTIIAQGDQTDSIYFLKEGSCRVIKRMQLNRRQREMLGLVTESPRSGAARHKKNEAPQDHMLEIGDLNARQYFGELAMLQKRAHTASVVSVTPVEVLILSKYDFYHLLDEKTQSMMINYAEKFYFGVEFDKGDVKRSPEERAALEEDSIKHTIQDQHEWTRYKAGLTRGLSSVPNSPRNGGGRTPRGGR